MLLLCSCLCELKRTNVYPLVTFEFSMKIEMVLDRYLIILTINEFFGGNMCVMGGRHHKLRTLFHFLKIFYR